MAYLHRSDDGNDGLVLGHLEEKLSCSSTPCLHRGQHVHVNVDTCTGTCMSLPCIHVLWCSHHAMLLHNDRILCLYRTYMVARTMANLLYIHVHVIHANVYTCTHVHVHIYCTLASAVISILYNAHIDVHVHLSTCIYPEDKFITSSPLTTHTHQWHNAYNYYV